MAEMGEGGQYTLRVDGKEMGINEAMEKFKQNSEVFKKFKEDQKEVDMKDLAKNQLTALEKINASVLEMTAKVPAALSGSGAGQQMLNNLVKAQTSMVGSVSKIYGDTNKMINKFNSPPYTTMARDLSGPITTMQGATNFFGTTVGTFNQAIRDTFTSQVGLFRTAVTNLGTFVGSSFTSATNYNTAQQIGSGNIVVTEDFYIPSKDMSGGKGTYVKTLQADSIVGGTGMEPLLKMMESGQKFPSPEQMMATGVMSFLEKQGTGGNKNEISLVVKVEGKGVDENQITSAVVGAMKNPAFGQALSVVVKKAATNTGLQPTKYG